jgi:hypothetical protein
MAIKVCHDLKTLIKEITPDSLIILQASFMKDGDDFVYKVRDAVRQFPDNLFHVFAIADKDLDSALCYGFLAREKNVKNHTDYGGNYTIKKMIELQ